MATAGGSTPARLGVAVALFVGVGLPAALVAGMLPAAALRSALRWSMAGSAVVGLALALCAWALALAATLRRGGVRVEMGVPALLVAAWLPLRMVQVLVESAPQVLVTIGGGDFGNHLWIAAQLADRMPGVYLGCTGWHMTLWAVSHALGMPMAEAAAWAVHLPIGVALALLGVGVVQAASAGWRGRPALAAAIVAALSLCLAAEHFGFAVLHYLAAEGFVAQLHALLPWALLWLGLACAREVGAALVVTLLCVVAMRYSYAMDMPALLVGVALLAAAATRRPPIWPHRLGVAPQSWPFAARALLVGLCALAVLQAALLMAQLGLSWHKPGSLLHPTTLGRLWALCLGGAGAFLLLLLQPHARPLAASLWAQLGFGALLVALHLLHPEWPREYYFYKHGMWLEIMGLCAIAAAAGAAAGKTLMVLGDTAVWGEAGSSGVASASGVAAPTMRASASAILWRPAVALATLVLAVALALFTPLRVSRSNPVLSMGYEERIGLRPWAQVSPLVDGSLLALADAVRADGYAVQGVLHPHWPVHSFMTSAVHDWRPIEPALEVGLHDRRWIPFLHGDRPQPGACLLVAAGTHRLASWRRHAQVTGGVGGARVLADLAGAARCVDGPAMAAGLPAERACAVCGPRLVAP